MSGITTDYFAIVSTAPTTAPSVPAGEPAFRLNTANSHFYGWDGSAWQDLTSGGGSVSLTNASAQLGSDVTMTSTNTFYDGPSVSLAAGTWWVIAGATLENTSGVGTFTAKLWDGTTPVDSGSFTAGGATYSASIPLGWIVTPGGTTTYKVSACSNTAGGVLKAAAPSNGAGNNATWITAVKIG